MPATRHDITVEVGADFAFELTWKQWGAGPPNYGAPVDVTGYTARMQIRRSHTDAAVLLSLTSSPGGEITLGGVAGTISVAATAAQTALLPLAESGLVWGVYDLELVSPGGAVTRLVEGRVRITSEVTRP